MKKPTSRAPTKEARSRAAAAGTEASAPPASARRVQRTLPAPTDRAAEEALLWAAVQQITADQRRKIEAGNGEQLIEVLLTWLMVDDEPMPAWLRMALYMRLFKYKAHWSRTLDEAFNVSRPQGYQRAAAQREGDVATRLLWAMCTLESVGVQLNDEAFEAVGEAFKISKTTARKYYNSRIAAAGGKPVFDAQTPSELPAWLQDIHQQINPKREK